MNSEKLAFDPEEICKILSSIAQNNDVSSNEYQAVELAAKALLFIQATGQFTTFNKYLTTFNDDLTDQQRQFITTMGFESNSSHQES